MHVFTFEADFLNTAYMGTIVKNPVSQSLFNRCFQTITFNIIINVCIQSNHFIVFLFIFSLSVPLYLVSCLFFLSAESFLYPIFIYLLAFDCIFVNMLFSGCSRDYTTKSCLFSLFRAHVLLVQVNWKTLTTVKIPLTPPTTLC